MHLEPTMPKKCKTKHKQCQELTDVFQSIYVLPQTHTIRKFKGSKPGKTVRVYLSIEAF